MQSASILVNYVISALRSGPRDLLKADFPFPGGAPELGNTSRAKCRWVPGTVLQVRAQRDSSGAALPRATRPGSVWHPGLPEIGYSVTSARQTRGSPWEVVAPGITPQDCHSVRSQVSLALHRSPAGRRPAQADQTSCGGGRLPAAQQPPPLCFPSHRRPGYFPFGRRPGRTHPSPAAQVLPAPPSSLSATKAHRK